PRPELDPERNALQLPLVELEAGPALLALVEANAQAGGAELRRQPLARHADAFARDGHDDDLMRRDRGWEAQARIVPMGHDQRAHEPRARAPRRRVDVLLVPPSIGEPDGERARPVLAEVLPSRP